MSNIILSHSALSNFETCPHQYYRRSVKKDVKNVPGPEAAWGTYVHECFDNFVTKGTPLPADVRQYEKLMQFIADIPHDERFGERKLGVTADLEPCDFFHKGGYLRGIVDLVIIRSDLGIVVDYKTGKSKYATDAQAKRSAVLVFAHHPQVQRIASRFLYVKEGHTARDDYIRSEMSSLMRDTYALGDQIADCLEAGDFPKTPNNLCGWCPVMDCEHRQVKMQRRSR